MLTLRLTKYSFFQLLLFFLIPIIFIKVCYLVFSSSIVFFSPEYTLALPGMIIEYLAVLFLILVFLYITNNFVYSLLISHSLYLVFLIMSLLKIKLLKAPIVYYDLFQVDDLLKNISSIGTQSMVLSIVSLSALCLLVFVAIRRKNSQKHRSYAFILILVFGFFSLYSVGHVKNYLNKYKIKYKWNSNIYIKAQKHGLLTFFIQSIYFSNHLQKPQNYSVQLADKYLKQYDDINKPGLINNEIESPDNIIILLIESFQDIQQLPWKANKEITPAYNKMKSNSYSGDLISPVFGGKSVNAEFELLTSFSSVFTPFGSIPYKDFVKQNIPSLARQLKSYDYISNVIQVVEMKGYGYQSIYKFLGFDNKYSLSKHNKSIELDPTQRFGSSDAISTQIIEIVDKQEKSFIFAFPNSSHSPWKLNDYPENEIELINSRLNLDESNEIIAYYNAISHVDLLIKNLYNKFVNSNEKTLILIIGDHQPSLKVSLNNTNLSSSLNNKIDNHLVPYLFWSNYKLKFPSNKEKFTSMNLISAKLLNVVNLQASGFYKFIIEINKTYKAFSFALLKNNQTIDIYKNWTSEIVQQYQIIQYKYLSGDV